MTGSPKPEASFESLYAILQLVPELHASAGGLVQLGAAADSRAARDAKLSLGHLVAVSACQQLGSAVDHLMAWHGLFTSGLMPAFAHISLLRVAIEGTATCKWLVDGRTTSRGRVHRAAVAQREDYRQRKLFEEANTKLNANASPPTDWKSGAERLTEHDAAMTAAGMTTERMPGATTLVAGWGAGESVYRLTSGYTHRLPWIVSTAQMHAVEADKSIRGATTMRITGDERLAAGLTAMAVNDATETFERMLQYFGRRREEVSPPVSRGA